uniref:ComF family protein n=1 Tax=Candidatus Kentrum sp. MB TaxID=2138164 RepID=A0A451BAW1_9GAMM|nr:MAG: comF family protein [Candidatus Kentron sp. MB]VFK31250.1 MAG: comF family protein [Candidatus Kentron sp. MB]VFK75417.1 MAG: comF family protein [Candidatus Kentron sp. MB]
MFIPTNCLLCGATVTGNPNLCVACRHDLTPLLTACPVCGISLPEVQICPGCQRRKQPFTHTHAAFRYAPPVSYLVILMKFQGNLAAARVLSDLLANHLISVRAGKPDMIIPVPLHTRRLRERGFNQSVELGREIARRWRIPVRKDIIIKKRATPPQTELTSRAARRRNVRGTFLLDASLSNVNHVAILDDVVTTGATVTEIARLIKRAGVPRVDIWCCCRAGL